MDSNKYTQRTNIFYEELFLLKKYKLINQNQYNDINSAYSKLQEQRRYTESLLDASSSNANQQDNGTQHIIQSSINQAIAVEVIPVREKAMTNKIEKKVKSTDEIRERNITWSLILGVIMLLTAGLILSTSNWSYMSDILKVISIVSVSVLFMSLSWFTEKVLRLNKTSFAFLILGSSFIPIIFVGVGFFQLFGSWLSFFGEGKYVLGLIGAAISCFVYSVNAKKYNSKLFIWLSYITFSAIVAFALAAIQLGVDMFYLGILLYNALILIGYHRYKNIEKIQWIVKEVPLFSQINLVLSSVFTLFFFENHLFYSFNIIIVSVLYIAMMYTNQSKNYHLAFTAFLAYGFFQLANYAPLHNIKELIIASIALVFIGLQYVQKNNDNLKKLFQWTCAVISFFAFLYVSIQSIVLGSQSNAITMLSTYLMLSLIYVYLSHITSRTPLAYLATMFSLLSVYQLYKAIPSVESYFEVFHFIFISGLLYVLYFKKQSLKWLVNLKQSALVINCIAYIVIVFSAINSGKWLTAFILALLVAIIFYSTSLKEKNILTKINVVLAPLLLVVSSLSLYEVLALKHYDLALHYSFTFVGIMLLSHVLQKWDISSTATFHIPQIFFAILLICIPFVYIENKAVVIPLVMLLSLLMAYAFIRRVGKAGTWIIFATLSSLFYFSLLYPITELFDNIKLEIIYLLVYPVVFILLMRFMKSTVANYFYWTSLIFSFVSNAAALIMILIFSDEFIVLTIIIPGVVYAYNAVKGNSEVRVKLNLYAALIAIPLVMLCFIEECDLFAYEYTYIGVISSIIMLGIWLLTNTVWKRRLDWFIIPYLLIYHIFALASLNEDYVLINISLCLTVLATIYVIHKRKWHAILILPLIQMLILLFMFTDLYRLSDLILLVIGSLIVLVLHYVSRRTIQLLNFRQYFDWYFICSLILILLMELYLKDANIVLWLVPTILLSYVLFLASKRVTSTNASKVIMTLTVISLFSIYYKVIVEFYDSIWAPILIELLVAPFIVGVILLKSRVWENTKVMNTIEWLILLLSGLFIVFDAIIASTIADTIVMGILGLVGVIVGMSGRIKSYFLVGSGIILVTLYTQTRPLWGSMPWWVYLLVAGIVLIGFAGIHEWQRQHDNVIKNKLTTLRDRFKSWK